MKFRLVMASLLAAGLIPGLAHAQIFDAVRDVIADVQGGRYERDLRGGPRVDPFQDGQGRGGGRAKGDDGAERPAPPPPQAPRLVPLNQVVSQIQRQVPGDLLDASGPSGGDRPVYRIRWQAKSGQRIDFVVDALNGRIISRSGG